MEPLEVLAEQPLQLEAGKRVEVLAENLNDRLRFKLAGEFDLSLEIPPAVVQKGRINLATEGGGAEFSELRVYRDIFYTSAGQGTTRWVIPEGNYVVLGDNTQNSADSRDWSLTRFEIPLENGETQIVRGNNRGTENPIIAHGADGRARVYLADEFGERWVFHRAESRALKPTPAPFVPRSLIRGRAVLVVWPMVPKLDVYRLKWVR